MTPNRFEIAITLFGVHFYVGPLDDRTNYGVVFQFRANPPHVWRAKKRA